MRAVMFGLLMTFSIQTASADDIGAKIILIPGDPDWSGMFLTNVGNEPITVSSITFNGREDCIAIAHPVSETMYEYLKYETGMMFFPLTGAEADDENFEPLPVQVKVGDRVVIIPPKLRNDQAGISRGEHTLAGSAIITAIR